MRLIRVGQWCLLAMFAIGAFWAAGASAAEYEVKGLPEAGRCVKVAKGAGFYQGGSCITKAVPGKGQWEWTPASASEHLTFSGTGGESILATTGHPTIKCTSAHLSGEYTGPKTASVQIEFQGCVNSALEQCQSSPVTKSVIKTLPLEAELGFIRNEVKEGKRIAVVGLDLKGQSPAGDLIVYQCAGLTETARVEGSVIGKITPVNKMTTSQKLLYSVKKSVEQSPEKFQGGLKDTLTTTFESLPEPTSAPSTLEIKSETGTNAVPLEIKAKER